MARGGRGRKSSGNAAKQPVEAAVAEPLVLPLPPALPNTPEKAIWRTPPFWQTCFSGCLVLNAVLTYLLLSQQRSLVRQQVVGTQAATVGLGLSLYPNNALSVMFDQRGTVAARNVRFEFHAVRKEIPDLANIGEPIKHTAYEAVIAPNAIYAPKEYPLPGLTDTEMEAVRRTEQTVLVTGVFTFDNGFGDTQRQEVCSYWLAGIPNRTEPEGGANGFFPCDGFATRLNNVLKARRAEAKNGSQSSLTAAALQ